MRITSCRKILFVLSFSIPGFFPSSAYGWGFWAHREINRRAVDALPKEMSPFFQKNVDYLSEHSVDPDKRRFTEKDEGPRHFIDIDRYGEYPFSALPRGYADAVRKFGEDSLIANGIVPWRIVEMTEKLSSAIRSGNKDSIMYDAANLGHYVADAHVPLHTVDNYDGQKSNQVGIHSRWESEIPERFHGNFVLAPSGADFVSDLLEYSFGVVLESYTFVKPLLQADINAKEGLQGSDLFTVKENKGRTTYIYSSKYYDRFYSELNGMVEQRMEKAIHGVASLWYTAWVNAGKPSIDSLSH